MRMMLWVLGLSMAVGAAPAWGADQGASLSAKAVEAIKRLESDDAYQRQTGFLELEALRELATLDTVRTYLDSRDADMRAYSLRALAAIEGLASVPVLLERLTADRHPRVRRAALLGLEPFQAADPAVLPACIAALRDRKVEVRMDLKFSAA